MKTKIAFMYIGLILVLVLFVVFTSGSNANMNSDINSVKLKSTVGIKNKMVNTTTLKPNKNNVSKNVFHKLAKYKEALKKNPNDTLKIRKYAELLSLSHKPKEAIKYYKKLLKISPNKIDILFNISFIYYSIMNYNGALKATKKILKISPNNTKANYNVGALYASKGEREKARKIWTDLIKNYPVAKESKLAKTSLKKL